MAADLLRRAAAKVREVVGGVPAYFTQPWPPVVTDSEPPAEVTAEQGLNCACAACEHFEPYREGIAAYAALMHPSVALALADWLESHADDMANCVEAWERDPGYINRYLGGVEHHTAVSFAKPIALAKAILREPEETS